MSSKSMGSMVGIDVDVGAGEGAEAGDVAEAERMAVGTALLRTYGRPAGAAA